MKFFKSFHLRMSPNLRFAIFFLHFCFLSEIMHLNIYVLCTNEGFSKFHKVGNVVNKVQAVSSKKKKDPQHEK